jgi:hypothetical protein
LLLLDAEQFTGFGAEAFQFVILRLLLLHPCDRLVIPQGRFKAFPVSADERFLRLCRYGARNPPRAGLVRSADGWRWGSLWRRAREGSEELEA